MLNTRNHRCRYWIIFHSMIDVCYCCQLLLLQSTLAEVFVVEIRHSFHSEFFPLVLDFDFHNHVSRSLTESHWVSRIWGMGDQVLSKMERDFDSILDK